MKSRASRSPRRAARSSAGGAPGGGSCASRPGSRSAGSCTRTAGAGAPIFASVASSRKPYVIASASPMRHRRGARAREQVLARRPFARGADGAGAPPGSRRTRARAPTSSMRSISRAMSGRCVGTREVRRAAAPSSARTRAAEALEDRDRLVSTARRPRGSAPSRARAERNDASARAAWPARESRPSTARAPGELGRERRRVREHLLDVARIDPALEAVARLRVQPVPPRRAPDSARVEVRALEEDALRRRADLAVRRPHDPRERRPAPRRRR